MFGLGQDQAAARTAQGLVGGGGDEVGDTDRAGVVACRDQTGVVRHVHEQISTDAVGDGAEALPVDDQRVSGCSGHDHLGLVFVGQLLYLVVIDLFLVVQAVLDGVVQLAADVHRGAVGQVAAVRQTHAQNGVAGLEHGNVHALIRLRAGMRLDVGIFGTEQRLGAVDGQLLGHVDEFAAAVIALAGIALGVFVGQLAALRFHHCRAGVVFRGDQLDVILLATVFVLNRGPKFGIGHGNGVFGGEHGKYPKNIVVKQEGADSTMPCRKPYKCCPPPRPERTFSKLGTQTARVLELTKQEEMP